MAQVILENIYKSFSSRGGEPAPKTVAAEPLLAPIDKSSVAVKDSARRSHATSVLRAINLTIEDGEFMVLVGPSGCGKSTLLRLIAGLEELTGGNIYVGDRLVNNLAPKERDIAMVFQNYALYPHMTVYENLAFGLRRTKLGSRESGVRNGELEGRRQEEGNERSTQNLKLITQNSSPHTSHLTPHTSLPVWAENLLIETTRKLPKGLRFRSARERSIDQQVRSVAQILQIEPLLHRLPKQLSGGQKQRVALGRAMARNPQVFLMDEPLSNLDAKLRAETRSQIVKLQRQLGTTTIYVTHDQTEAMTMGDRIAVMNAGQIQQIASPLELYNHPANRFVAEFIGSPPMNFLPVQFKAPLLITHSQFRLTLPEAWETALKPYDGQTLTLGIRPEHLNIGAAAPKNLPVQVELVEALGSETYLAVRFVGASDETALLQARIEPDRAIKLGEELWLSISADKIHFFDQTTGQAIVPRN
ncbi:ABC transporter ATP-binding protein [Leptolyngbya sp. FACHB-321]|uniref:ATP-binding cassette domain-containing protein n=1 Tax=Leptolyngbya sp. FACHB-321 TaxID=2692807 RepID=UPI00168286E6|nr:ABC transporter ATP-binding protein [Leptolyngbya sp. FACHB-321]